MAIIISVQGIYQKYTEQSALWGKLELIWELCKNKNQPSVGISLGSSLTKCLTHSQAEASPAPALWVQWIRQSWETALLPGVEAGLEAGTR